MTRLLILLILVVSIAFFALAEFHSGELASFHQPTVMVPGSNFPQTSTLLAQTLGPPTGTIVTAAPFQPGEAAKVAAHWPHYSDALVEMSYPPGWTYTVDQTGTGIFEIDGAEFNYGQELGGGFDIVPNPFPIAAEFAHPEIIPQYEGATSLSPNEYLLPDKDYPALAFDLRISTNAPDLYQTWAYLACGDELMRAVFTDGEESFPLSPTSTLHAIVNSLQMKQCVLASSTD